jgi:hypothetical protein
MVLLIQLEKNGCEKLRKYDGVHLIRAYSPSSKKKNSLQKEFLEVIKNLFSIQI